MDKILIFVAKQCAVGTLQCRRTQRPKDLSSQPLASYTNQCIVHTIYRVNRHWRFIEKCLLETEIGNDLLEIFNNSTIAIYVTVSIYVFVLKVRSGTIFCSSLILFLFGNRIRGRYELKFFFLTTFLSLFRIQYYFTNYEHTILI